MSNEPTSCTWAMTESPSPTRLANRAVFWRCVVTISSPNMNYTRTAGLVVSSLLLGFLMGAYRCNVIILWSGLKHTWHLQTAPFGGPLGCWRDQYSEERVFGMPLAGAPSQGSTCWCKAFFACCARILPLKSFEQGLSLWKKSPSTTLLLHSLIAEWMAEPIWVLASLQGTSGPYGSTIVVTMLGLVKDWFTTTRIFHMLHATLI